MRSVKKSSDLSIESNIHLYWVNRIPSQKVFKQIHLRVLDNSWNCVNTTVGYSEQSFERLEGKSCTLTHKTFTPYSNIVLYRKQRYDVTLQELVSHDTGSRNITISKLCLHSYIMYGL